MTLRRIAPVLLLTASLANLAAAQPAARARVSVGSKGDIWVGQRVTIVVELLAPGTFASAPSFDLPQVPGVILIPPEGRPVIGSETIGDVDYTSQRHELQVYAQRPGEVQMPEFAVRFESSPAFGQPATDERVVVPAVSFTAKMPPGAEGLSMVITTHELRFEEKWRPQPDQPAKPGDAFIRTITVEAKDVPAMALPAFRFDAPDGLRAYPKSPVVHDQTDRGDLTGRRVETATYVCEKAGSFSLPALVLAWWDPETQKLKRVELPAQTIEVTAPPHVAAAPTPAQPPHRPWIWPTAMAGLLAAAALVWRFGPVLRSWHRDRRESAGQSEAEYFAAFERACRGADTSAAYRALLVWLDRYFDGNGIATIGMLAARADDLQLTAELTALENVTFGKDRSAGLPWSPERLLLRTRAARSRLRHQNDSARASGAALPPLNPVRPGSRVATFRVPTSAPAWGGD